MKYVSILIVFACLSCSTVARKMYNVTDPKLQTVGSVKKYLATNGIDTTRVLFFRDLMSFAQASEHKFLSFPDAFFFNSSGEAVSYPKTTENCNAQVGTFIQDLKAFSKFAADGERNIQALLPLLTPDVAVDGTNPSLTVFITFTTYSGKLNREKAFEWVKLLDKAKKEGVPIEYYLLSADYMQSWNIPIAVQKKLGIN